MSKFDLTVHHRSPKTGRVIRTTPYKLHIENGRQVFERDGVKYAANGEVIEAPLKKEEKKDVDALVKELAPQKAEAKANAQKKE